jgi:HNH endonuclease
MGKLHKNNNYRKIYEDYYGKIPKGYHIHHIDGNPLNNDINNLECVSSEEHSTIHKNDFIKWAYIGGELGGKKSKEEKLGFCAWDFEKRSQISKNRKYSKESKIKKSNTLKLLYKTGEMVHWSKLYDKEVVSEKIKKGDPGKSNRGKPAKNRTKIICIQTGKIYESQLQAANELGLKQTDIANVLSGRQKTTKNYSFNYL